MAARDNTGVCRSCFRSFSGRGMTRHLQACAKKREYDQELVGRKRRLQRIFHMKITATYGPAYWLHLEVDAEATFAELDGFLRRIWLECCGHMSEFTVSGLHGASEMPLGGLFWDEDDADSLMVEELGDMLAPKEGFEYVYDFGSSTHLSGKVMGERTGLLRSPITILARNDPLVSTCDECGQRPAAHVDVEVDAVLCDECACDDDGEPDEMCLPLVNSPRTGVCGYCGELDSDDFAVPGS